MMNGKRRTYDSGAWVMEEEESDPGSRSCLSFRFRRHKNPHEKQGPGSGNNKQERAPVFHSPSSFVTPQTPLVTPSSKSSSEDSPLGRLLKPPMPEDRRKRAAYEVQKRKNGLYEGELEPEGHRGQEMTIPVAAAVVSPEDSSSSIQIRNFDSKSNPVYHGKPTKILLGDEPPSVDEEQEQAGPEDEQQQSSPRLTQKDENHPPRLFRAEAAEQSSGQLEPSCTDEQRAQREPRGTVADARLLSRPPRPPPVNSNRPPQFTPSLKASKASSPANADAASFLGEDDGDSSSSSSSLKKFQQDFLNDAELLPSDEDEEEERGEGEKSYLPISREATTNRRSFFPSSTPNTPSTAATSTTHSVASSSANNVATVATDTTADTAQRNVNALHALAMEHVHNGELESAVSILETVVTLQTRIHGKISPQVASAHHNLGTVHAKRAQMMTDGSVSQAHLRALALQYFQTAARTARDSLGRYHGNVSVSLVRMGFLLLQARHYQNAVIVFQEALRIRLNVYGSRHLLVANLYNNLGVCHMHLGEFAKGKEYLVAALDIQRDLTSGSIHQLELADTLFNIGGLCVEWIRRQGPDSRRAVEAEEAFAESYEIRKSVLGPDDTMTVQVQALLEMARAVPRPKVFSSSRHKLPRSPDRSAPYYKGAPLQEPLSVRRTEGGEPVQTHEHKAEEAIFRSSSSPPRKQSQNVSPPLMAKKERAPPLSHVSVSKDDDEHDDSTRVFVLSHHVPLSSPSAHSSSDDAVNLSMETSFTPDVSVNDAQHKAPGASSVQKAVSYDAEENCLISETGVESERGKIHYPLSWNRAGLEGSGAGGSPSRDIMVTRPFRRREWATHADVRTEASALSDNWGSETVNFSTGNKDRDDVMTRAKKVLDAHRDLPDLQDPNSPSSVVHSPTDVDYFDDRKDAKVVRSLADNLVQEDGVAALGGDWPRENDTGISVRDMLADPMNHLHLIHEEATKRLHENDALDSLPLFETVLECQRRRHGQLHPDVASALHNVGIVHLRAQNHAEALKAFEEAARIRKGSLGREHPQVAESLVKVGITLLLLHRFEDALWSFREALSTRKHAMGNLHPSTARIYNNIGCVHVEFNEYRDARRAFEAALDIQRNALAQDPDSGPLMFATATTLCNLGYLYRFRDMHSKAALVLKEACELQERVLGRSHSTVLSTIDNLADACANSGQAGDALKYYGIVLDRFRVGSHQSSGNALRAQAVLLYKMSRVHKQSNDRQAQLGKLKLALRAVRENPASTEGRRTDTLERRIQYDIRTCREQLEKEELEYI